MSNRVVFRVEGNDQVGHGHFMRCLSMARHLSNAFDCVFAMSLPSGIALRELDSYGLALIKTPERAQFHPDDERSREPWQDDLAPILMTGDVLVLDGYRFNETFIQGAHLAGARVIQVVDQLETLPGVDGVITPLPVLQESFHTSVSPSAIWTGLDGFLLRPEFFQPGKPIERFDWDWFIYVANEGCLSFYKSCQDLKNSRVLALASSDLVIPEKLLGWDLLLSPTIDELVHRMRACARAMLPASTIAIEFLVATGRNPEVRSFATNQVLALNVFSKLGYWKVPGIDSKTVTLQRNWHSPREEFITWMHGRF